MGLLTRSSEPTARRQAQSLSLPSPTRLDQWQSSQKLVTLPALRITELCSVDHKSRHIATLLYNTR